MSDWEPGRMSASHVQAGLAALALIGCVALAGWQLARSTESIPPSDSGVAAAQPRGTPHGEGADATGLRPAPIAQAAPPGAAVSLGTTMPHDAPVPRIDVDRGVIRWPQADPDEEWRETPLPTFTMENQDRALSIGAEARFEAKAVAFACEGVVAPDLMDLQNRVGAGEMTLTSELEGLTMRQEDVLREANDAEAAQAGADALQALAEAACAGPGLGPLSLYALAESETRGGVHSLDEAAAIVKNMKPKPAAKLVETWDRAFAATAMARLPARVSAPIFAQMNPDFAGNVTEAMLASLAFRGSTARSAQRRAGAQR